MLEPAPVFPSWSREADILVRQARCRGRSIAVAPGCFDVLHDGHILLLRTVWKQVRAPFVLVALNSDASVARLKGPTRPLQDFTQRSAVLAALRYVHAVVGFDEDAPERLCQLVQPDWVVKGFDYVGKTVPEARYARCGLLLVRRTSSSTTELESRLRRNHDRLSG